MKKIYVAFLASLLSLITVSCSKSSSGTIDPEPEPNKEFFKFEFEGTTYSLGNLMVSQSDNGFYITGNKMEGNTPTAFGVNVIINSQTPSPTIGVPFGDISKSNVGAISFTFQTDKNYISEYSDCDGDKLYSGGNIKLTAVGGVGKYVEGNFSGSAYDMSQGCPGTPTPKSIKGSFKILRKF